MNITLKQLQIIKAVHEQQSITNAAKQLFLVQSAVSHQLSQIESQLDKKIVEIIGKKVFLTEAGQLLLKHAEVILDQIQILQEDVNDLNNYKSLQGELIVSLGVTTGYKIYPFLKLYSDLYPKVKITVFSNDFNTQLAMLNDNQVDFTITTEVNDKGIQSELLCTSSIKVVCSTLHPLSKKKTITIDDLKECKFIIGQQASLNYEPTKKLLNVKNKLDHQFIYANNYNCIKQLVIENIGFALLPAYMIVNEVENNELKILNIDGFNMSLNIYLHFHRNKQFDKCTKKFIDLLLGDFPNENEISFDDS